MSANSIAIASSSELATDAGKTIAHAGGNAVDAALAAALVTLITEPGVVALGGGGYVTIQTPSTDPVTIDGYMAVPGLGTGQVPEPESMQSVTMDYGGGVTTLVGHRSVCTPGALKALARASADYGRLSWHDVVQPAITVAEQGFPLSKACHNYLVFSHQDIFGTCPASYKALHDKQGNLLKPGDQVFLADLADSLKIIAQEGVDAFYSGTIADLIVADMQAHDGSIDATDLNNYEVVVRPSLTFETMDWQISTNPPPAIGGATLAAMTLAIDCDSHTEWNQTMTQRMLLAQEFVLDYRRERLDTSTQLDQDIRALLVEATQSRQPGSPSTVHTSSVDEQGVACSITMSAGYGSGVISKDTGIWLNNSLGELELNRKNPSQLKPGQRMLSNMAPTVARHQDGRCLAIGSPGADRITTALAHTLIGYMGLGMDLEDAIAQPRVHLEWHQDAPRFAYEAGLSMPHTPHLTRPVDSLSMYFGGVGAVVYSPQSGFVASGDPRRAGSAIVVV